MITKRDFHTLFSLVFARHRGATHAARIENFYGPQASGYDAFRWRILHGRSELYQSLPVNAGEVWADFGGGTAQNFESIAQFVPKLSKVHVFDLSPSLLAVARRRAEERGWTNFVLHEADVTSETIAETLKPASCDVTSFSYSLSMIPNWFLAIERALEVLKPGGVIGVVDFYAARRYPDSPKQVQSWWRRTIFPIWFAFDNVSINPDYVPYLSERFETIHLEIKRVRLPKTWIYVDYFHFIGRKK